MKWHSFPFLQRPHVYKYKFQLTTQLPNQQASSTKLCVQQKLPRMFTTGIIFFRSTKTALKVANKTSARKKKSNDVAWTAQVRCKTQPEGVRLYERLYVCICVSRTNTPSHPIFLLIPERKRKERKKQAS